MLIADRATCIIFFADDLPPRGSDHTLPLHIFVGCSRHRVPSVFLDNGSVLNVFPLAIIVALDFRPSDFNLSSQIVRAYDSTRREVLRIPTSFNLLLGRPRIHRAEAIPSFLHQKVKFIHEARVITIQSIGDTYSTFEPVLEISHGDDDLFLTGFTFDEIQTMEVEHGFGHDEVYVFFTGLGLGLCQHGSGEFIGAVDHDTPFSLGFVPIEADYEYMAQLRKERVRARLTHTPFNYPVHPYSMSLADYFVRAPELQTRSAELQCLVYQLRLSDGALGTSALALATPSSPDPVPHDEYIDERLAMSMGQIDEIFQPELASPFDLFGVSAIEVAEEIQIASDLEFLEDAVVVDVLFEGLIGPVEGASDFVDLPISFDVLSGFVSRSNDVHDSSFMDLSIFEYLPIPCDITLSAPSSPTSQIFDIDDEIVQHDSDDDSSSASDPGPIDQRVSPAIGEVKTVDFGLDPSIVQHCLLLLLHARPIKQKLRQLHHHWSLRMNEEIQKQLSVGFLSVVEYLEWLANVVSVPKKDSKRAATTLFHDMMHWDVEVYVDNMMVKSRDRVDHLATLERFFERIRQFKLRLNPKKCTFGVISRKLLGYMVSERGIEADPDKIRAILDMPAPRTKREIKGFLGRLYQPTLWDDQCQYAFERIREYLLSPPVLVLATPDCPLLLYLGSIVVDHLASLLVSDDRAIDDDFLDEDVAVASLLGWRMYFDGATNHSGYGIGFLLISPHGDHIPRSVGLTFLDRHPTTSNIVEYEACILGLETTHELGIRQIEVFGDSNVILRQIQGEWKTRDVKLRLYHAYLELLVGRFDDLRYMHLPRVQNQFVDALATLTSMIDILADTIVRPLLIDAYPEAATTKDKRALRQLAARFVICGETLYKRSTDGMLLLCLDRASTDRVMREVHAGACGPHMGGHMLAYIIGKISPKSSSGHELILVAIDYFTKWVEVASYTRLASSGVTKTVLSVEIKMGSLRVGLEQQISKVDWAQTRLDLLNLLDERRFLGCLIWCLLPWIWFFLLEGFRGELHALQSSSRLESIGIGDIIADATTMEKINEIIFKAKNEVKELIKVLNRARDDAGSSAQKSLLESNNLKAMVTIGSKGSFISISQMTTCVGIMVKYNGIVRNALENVIEFLYGEDGIDLYG
ncbi:hypothetical protein AAG906_017513 [Vitis piasezkii]